MFERSPVKIAARPAAEKKMVTCEICTDEKPDNEFAHLHCGHDFCKDCMQGMLAVVINDKKTMRLHCPKIGCKEKLTQQDIREITDDRDIINAIADIETKEFLAAHPDAKHCPTPNCSAIFFTDPNDRREVQCPQCHMQYCPQCLKHHDPSLTCAQAVAQAAAAAAQSGENDEWIKLFTKPCPSCKNPIEKTEGCRAMACSQCQGQFCWDCLTRLTNKYDAHPCVDVTQQLEEERIRREKQLDYLTKLAIKHKKNAQAPTFKIEPLQVAYTPYDNKKVTITFKNAVSKEFMNDFITRLKHKFSTPMPMQTPNTSTITFEISSYADEGGIRNTIEDTIKAIFGNENQPAAKAAAR